MTGGRVSRVLCAADPGGPGHALDALIDVAREGAADAIAIVGALGDASGAGLRALFKALADSARPTYFVPGPDDAPAEHFLREAANIETVAPALRGVHGTAAFAPDGHVVFAGFGGEVSDDPDAPRDETDRLAYPRWEPEYRLKVIRELDEHQLVLLFSTPPAHKGLGTDGADVLAELVGTYRPRLVVCGGHNGTEMLGRSLVVAPGSLADGHYAIADLNSHEVETEQLATGARAR